MNIYTIDFDTKHLDREILRLALPAAVENLLHMMVFFVDALMIARLSTVALAGVGLSGSVIFSTCFLFSAIGIAATSLVARAMGARDADLARLAAGQAMLLGTVGGLLATPVLLVCLRPLLMLMQAKPNVLEVGTCYGYIVVYVLVCRVWLFIAGGALRGAGDTRTPMLVTFIMNTTNLVLDYLLIFGAFGFPRMEVRGAAYGTAIATSFGAFLGWLALFRKRGVVNIGLGHVVRFDRKICWRLLRIAYPNAIEIALAQLGFFVFLTIVTALGTTALAAHQIAIRIESFSFMPGHALAVAAATLVGQSLGANRTDFAARAMRRCCFYALAIMGTMALAFLCVPRALAGLFGAAPEVLALAARCVRIAAAEQAGLAIYMVYSGGLRGAGDTLSPMLVSIGATFFWRVPLIYFLGITLGWGLAGVWLGCMLDWTARAAVIYVLYRRGRWERLRV